VLDEADVPLGEVAGGHRQLTGGPHPSRTGA
jgi:hypothetical protein